MLYREKFLIIIDDYFVTLIFDVENHQIKDFVILSIEDKFGIPAKEYCLIPKIRTFIESGKLLMEWQIAQDEFRTWLDDQAYFLSM